MRRAVHTATVADRDVAWPRPDVVVIGAQKAGSTFVADVVGRHPDVSICPDEVPIFEDPFYAHSDPAEFERALAAGSGGAVRGIRRPDYLARPEVPERLARHAPDAKLIVTLRDPVARAISAYSWYVQFRMLPLRPAEEGLSALLDGWDGGSTHPAAPQVLDYGRYGHHLARWLRSFDRSQLHVVFPSDLRSGAFESAIYRFVGVDDTVVADRRGSKRNEGVYDLRRLRLARAQARFTFAWEGQDRYTYQPRRWRRPVALVPAVGLKLVDRHLLGRWWGDEGPDLSPALIDRLRAYYESDRVALAAVLGRTIRWEA